MARITHYRISIYGSKDGDGTSRAIVTLQNGNNTVGTIRFIDPGLPIPEDRQSRTILMHLPLSLLASVIDVLRNESPMMIDFVSTAAVLRRAT